MSLGKLYLVKAQCHTSNLVLKVKVVERCFSDGHTVEFVMHDVAPKEGPPLPYFAVDGEIIGDENEVARHLASAGAKHLVDSEGLDTAAVTEVLLGCQSGIAQAVKTAVKSKDATAMATNKEALLKQLQSFETSLASKPYLAGACFSLADAVAMVDLRPAFEKVLEEGDRAKIPNLTKWYSTCFEQPAVSKVWGGQLTLCVTSELPVAKKKDKEALKAEKKDKEKAKKAEKKAAEAGESSKEVKKETKLGISSLKDEDFASWYTKTVTEAELISYYAVSGCYILRPWAFAMWEFITKFFDEKIKSIDVQNCMFPLFITEDVLNKEQDHIEDFAPEVAWVTRSGLTELERPLAIRPTSETAMYPYFAQWIRSHRDLPLKLNQWTNVVRWEFKHPTPFIRSREFLWQEGHTAHETLEDAMAEVHQILGWYKDIYQELLAVPVVSGWKTEKEKFAGAYKTLTVEAFIPATGKGVQGATSHCLGQNFSKMFEIEYETRTGGKAYAWQNSWGCTTRSLGVMIMTHGDDKGLVLPPRVAAKQVVIIPIPNSKMSDEEKAAMDARAVEIEKELAAAGVRVTSDMRDNYTPGWKYNHWELKGVPIRLELGPKDMEKKSIVAALRYNGKKEFIAWSDLAKRIPELLDEIQAGMLANATEKFDACKDTAYNMEEFKKALDAKHMVLAPWADEKGIEDEVKKVTTKKASEVEEGEGGEAGAKALCIPLDQPPMPEGTKCFFTGKPAKNFCLWGRSY